MLFIDLDDLKTTNDTLGHEAGDDLLNAAATRLRQAVGSMDVVGRHGGDEFVLLVDGDATRGELDDLVRRLRVRLRTVVLAETAVPFSTSIGIVDGRGDPRTGDDTARGPGDVQGQAAGPDSACFGVALVGEQVHHAGEDTRKMLGGRHDS